MAAVRSPQSALACTAEHGVSTAVDDFTSNAERDRTKPVRAQSLFAAVMLVLAAAVAIVSVALTVRAYMPCPFWDGWDVIANIANGARPWSWTWLWSQHNEHRIATARLLIWLDWAAFGGKNISLFVEMYLIQIIHCAVVWYALERLTNFPRVLRRTIQGLFAFCLFHPNQAQNFTWSFQVSFILAFAIGTTALLSIAFFEKVTARWRWPILMAVGCAPILAATNLASGLLIGPAIVCLACVKRLPRRAIVLLAALSSLSIVAYVYHYQTPPGHPSPIEALSHAGDVFRYVSTLMGASWPLLSPAYISAICFGAWIVVTALRHQKVSAFEWFCVAECGVMIATTLLVACGRLQYGIMQAAESRYQTPAMIYWASLLSLVLIAVWRLQPASLGLAQLFVLLIASSSLPFVPGVWRKFVDQADWRRDACLVVSGNYSARAARILHPNPEIVKQGLKVLPEKSR